MARRVHWEARKLARSGYGIAMIPRESAPAPDAGSGLAVIPGLPRVRLAAISPGASAVCDVATRIGQERAAG